MADKTMVDYTRKIKPYFEGVAPIEPTTTAASAHAIGDIFYLDGALVRATVAISIGDTIAVGTNVVAADDVETQISSLNQTLANKVGTVTSKTLAANATSVQFDVPTSGDYVIDFFSSDGSNYTAIDLSVSGKATLTFDADASARTISCRVATE